MSAALFLFTYQIPFLAVTSVLMTGTFVLFSYILNRNSRDEIKTLMNKVENVLPEKSTNNVADIENASEKSTLDRLHARIDELLDYLNEKSKVIGNLTEELAHERNATRDPQEQPLAPPEQPGKAGTTGQVAAAASTSTEQASQANGAPGVENTPPSDSSPDQNVHG